MTTLSIVLVVLSFLLFVFVLIAVFGLASLFFYVNSAKNMHAQMRDTMERLAAHAYTTSIQQTVENCKQPAADNPEKESKKMPVGFGGSGTA